MSELENSQDEITQVSMPKLKRKIITIDLPYHYQCSQLGNELGETRSSNCQHERSRATKNVNSTHRSTHEYGDGDPGCLGSFALLVSSQPRQLRSCSTYPAQLIEELIYLQFQMG